MTFAVDWALKTNYLSVFYKLATVYNTSLLVQRSIRGSLSVFQIHSTLLLLSTLLNSNPKQGRISQPPLVHTSPKQPTHKSLLGLHTFLLGKLYQRRRGGVLSVTFSCFLCPKLFQIYQICRWKQNYILSFSCLKIQLFRCCCCCCVFCILDCPKLGSFGLFPRRKPAATVLRYPA